MVRHRNIAAQNDAALSDLEQIAACKADRRTQREMHEDVRRNTMLQQRIVGIEKQNVIAMTGCEAVQTRC
jgi:hypothetical protein